MSQRAILVAVGLVLASCSGGEQIADSTPVSSTSTMIADVSTTSTRPTTSSTPALPTTTRALPPTTTTPPFAVPTFVIFMPRGLSSDFADRVTPIDGLTAVGLIHTETLHIVETRTAAGDIVDQPDDGFVIPVQGAWVDATGHRSFVAPDIATLLASLSVDEILLGESSADLRGIGAGGTITFDSGRTVTVSRVVSDTAFGSEEFVTTDSELVGGAGSELRFGIVEYAGSTDELRTAMAEVLPEGAGFGVHPRGQPADQTTAVRSQVWIKQTFGEFAYRPTGGGRFTIDPAWVEANIVVSDVPLLGSIRCHRRYIELLTEAMTSLIESGNEDSIDRSAFLGCWNSRYVANSTRLSRHAWGSAADINFFNSLDGGPGSPVNEALLEAMAMAGVTSGHDWSIPDPGHFEYYGFPDNE